MKFNVTVKSVPRLPEKQSFAGHSPRRSLIRKNPFIPNTLNIPVIKLSRKISLVWRGKGKKQRRGKEKSTLNHLGNISPESSVFSLPLLLLPLATWQSAEIVPRRFAILAIPFRATCRRTSARFAPRESPRVIGADINAIKSTTTVRY